MKLSEVELFDNRRTLAFLHIPKTSGVAINDGLKNAALFQRTYYGFDKVIFGGFREFDTLSPHLRDNLTMDWRSIPKGLALIAGHFSYDTLTKAFPDAQLVTFLREPLSRLISHWMYWRSLTDADLAWLGTFALRVKIARDSLNNFLAEPSIACQTDNVAIRMLLWPDPQIPQDGFIDPVNDEALLARALDRLATFSYVDIVENPMMHSNLECWIGCPVRYEKLNVLARLPKQLCTPLEEQLGPNTWQLMVNRARLDQEIWKSVATKRIPGNDTLLLAMSAVTSTVARHAVLMSVAGG